MNKSYTIAFGLGAVSVPVIAFALVSGAFASSQPAQPTAAKTQTETPVVSSIKVDDTKEQTEAQDAATLPALAKISADAASKAALIAKPGTVQSTTLENDGGNVVYSVIITNGTQQFDVKVDAGNGTVLKTDTEKQDAENGKDDAKDATVTGSAAADTPDANEATTGTDAKDGTVTGADAKDAPDAKDTGTPDAKEGSDSSAETSND